MRLLPDLVLVDGRFEPGRAVEISDGRVSGVAPFPPAWGDAAFADDLVRLPGRALERSAWRFHLRLSDRSLPKR